jgi:hypothetical protein
MAQRRAALAVNRVRQHSEFINQRPCRKTFEIKTQMDAIPLAQHLCLLLDGKVVLGVDHRFALSSPALVSAPSKKSFSSVNWPILA